MKLQMPTPRAAVSLRPLLTGSLAIGITVIALLTLSAQAQVSVTTLHSFGTLQDPITQVVVDGSSPEAPLIQASDGELYGTASDGGTNGFGTIFKITTNGTFTALYSFGAAQASSFWAADGMNPKAALLQGSDGNLYGTASIGGTNNPATLYGILGFGTVFKLTPDGTFSVLYGFGTVQDGSGNALDGADPVAALVQGSDGNFYGATSQGGPNGLVISNMFGSFPAPGDGTIFKLTPSGKLTTLYSFGTIHDADGNALDGQTPAAPLVQASDGAFYGTTTDGGTNSDGTIFKITPDGKFTPLYSFGAMPGGLDGESPQAALVQGADGNLYGTASGGGRYGDGTIFKITTSGKFTLVYSFGAIQNTNGDALDGANPEAALIQAKDGDFYGTTSDGGTNQFGTLFKTTASGAFTCLYSFGRLQDSGGSPLDGGSPQAALLQGRDGSFYGTTYEGGASNDNGTIFRLSAGSTAPGQPPVITAEPQSLALYPGAEADFSVQAFGASPLSFHWLKDGAYLKDTDNISGSTTPNLTLNPVLAIDQGSYSVSVTNAFGATNSTAATLTVTNLPQLTAIGVQTPAEVWTGSPFDVSWTDTNAGTVTASGPWVDQVYLSTNAELDPTVDQAIGETSFDGTLAPGQTAARTQSVTIYPEGLTSGQYHIFVLVDAFNDASMTNYFGMSAPFQVHVTLPPEVAVSGVTAPAEAWTKRSFEVDWTDTNAGGATAQGPWVDQVWLSTDARLDPGVDKPLGEFSFNGSLQAGESTLRQRLVSISSSGVTNGQYHILVLADADEDVSTAQNTTASSSLDVHLTPLARLAVTDVTAPATGLGGQSVQVSWTVCNQGVADTDVPLWYDHLYLSTTTDLSGVVMDFGTNENPSYLAVGDCYQQDVTVQLPVGISGLYYFVVSADDAGVVGADAPTNALGATAVPINIQLVTPGFLHVESVQAVPAAPTPVWAGDRIDVTWVVKNTGQSSVTLPSGFWWDDLAISPTTNYDYVHGRFGVAYNAYGGPTLAPGDTYTNDAAFYVPSDLATGTWYAVVVVDAPYLAGDADFKPGVIARDQGSVPFDVVSPPPVDLEVTDVAAPTTGFLGQPLSVTWGVVNNGLNSSSGSWYDGIYVSTNSVFDAKQAVLLGTITHWGGLDIGEGYTNDESFTLPADLIPPGQASAAYHLFVYADAGNTVSELSKDNNVLMAPSLLTIVPTPPPDLALTSLSGPSTILAGGPANLLWSVSNQGGPTIATNWVDSVYLSPDGTFDSNVDIWVADVPHNGALASGDSYTVAQPLAVPYCAIGSYFPVVVTDSGQKVSEVGTRANNVLATPAPMRILANGAARLGVSRVSSGVSATAGTSLAFSWTVVNSGNATTNAPWVDGIFLSPTPVYSSDESYLVGLYTNRQDVARGGSYTQTGFYTVPACLGGTYYATVVADLGNIVNSISCNTNNAAASTAAVQVAPVPHPSLQITQLVVPTALTSAIPATVQWQVTNAGTGPASGNWYDAVYASLSPTLGSDALLLGEFGHSGGLPAGAAYTQSQAVQIPACTAAGNYYLFVLADGDNILNIAPACQFENPRRSASALPVSFGLYPDLTVKDIVAPETANAGQPMTLSWTISNAGSAVASAPWVDAIYLSANLPFDPANAVLLGYHAESSSLTPGGTRSQTASFTLLDINGYFFPVVVADTTNAVEECYNETNNVTFSYSPIDVPISHYPELHVTSVQVPSTAYAGEPITVTWVVTNQGTAPTPQVSWYDFLYLSSDQVADTRGDLYLAGAPNVRSLAVGQSYTNSASVVLPAGEAGPLYILVDAGVGAFFDGPDDSSHIGWNSNAMLAALPPPVDLEPSNVTLAPSAATPGNPVTVGWTVSNVSANSTVNAWSDAVYLSTNTVLDLNATLLGNVDHTGLASSGTYNASWSGLLPSLNPGSYHAIVRSDVRNTAPESNPSGHVAVSSGTIALDVPVLLLGQTVTNQLRTGESQFYKVNCPAGETVSVTLAGGSPGSANELYVRFGAVPSLGAYDFIYQDALSPNQQIEIPTTPAGWYYIMVRGANEPGGPLRYTLGASVVPFTITSVSPVNIGDNGQVTMTVKGAKFQPGASVKLVSGSAVYTAQTNFFGDATSLRARFQFTNALHGAYDVVLTNPGSQSTTAPHAVSIETALPLAARVVAGDINLHPRVGLPFTWAGAVVNAGNVDIPYVSVAVLLDQQLPIHLNPPQEAFVTDSSLSDNSAGGGGFMARNLAPGGSLSFSFTVSDFGSGDFGVYVMPAAHSRQAFLQQVADGAAALRDLLLSSPDTLTYTATNSEGVITTNSVVVPPVIAAALADQGTWEQFVGQALASVNILDANDVNSLPAPSAAASSFGLLAKGRSPKSVGCDLCYAVTIFKELLAVRTVIKVVLCIATIETAGLGCAATIIATKIVTTMVFAITDYFCTHCPPPPWWVHPFWPRDPNEKEGPPGYSAAGFAGAQAPWPYTIYFENTSNALAYARQVTITDPLDPGLDIRSFRVGDIAIGNTNISVPPNRAYYQTRIALPPPNPPNVVADVTAGVDVQHHSLFWTMNAIDLNTGELVTGTQEGVLPPNTTNNIGAGHVNFTIKPASGAPTGTVITNQASIVFDTNPPLRTNPTTNTVDALPPTSSVSALPSVLDTATFPVSWSGTDDKGGSGVANYTIAFSDNGGPYQIWLDSTNSTSAQFTGQFGHTYAFYSTAEDNAGNTEAPHSGPDTVTSLASSPVIAPVSDQVARVGATLAISNAVSEADVPAPALIFSLGPSAPAGASIDPETGIFTWTPQCLQGSSTNLIEVRVASSDNPGVTNSMLFYAAVGDCVQVGVGSTVVQSGHRACVPVSLLTTVALTNLSFTLAYPPDRFGNWTVSATNPVVATASVQTLDSSHTRFQFTTKPGQPLAGPTSVGSLCFDALPGSSGFVSLAVTNVTGTESNGTLAGNAVGQPGREVVNGPEPLLDAWLGAGGRRMLTLYGNPGEHYQILSSTNLTSANWQTEQSLTLTNLVQTIPAAGAETQVYYRAVQVPGQ
jgi:uncharacterized repeat protein (TIGR03803 family)